MTHQSAALVAGASRGIGAAFVEALLQRRDIDQVHAVSRQPDKSDLLTGLRSAHPSRLFLHQADCTSETALTTLPERIGACLADGQKPRLRLLINCIGLLHDEQRDILPEKKLEQVSMASLEALFRVNAIVPILLARTFLPWLHHDQPACFATLSARVGSITDNRLGGWYSYRASKAAQNQLLHTFAIEAQRRVPSLTCLALHPGTTDTGLSQPFQRHVAQEKLFSPHFVAQRLLQIIDSAGVEQSGGFYAWDGSSIPW